MWTSVDCWSYYYSSTTMNWTQARDWCKLHYTDMVAIQNREEIDHLNSWLPRKPTYYWIGIRKVNNIWTWVGTNKALTEEATNWAKGEPNNGKGGKKTGLNEDCVEMYIKRDMQPGKWNDERCGKLKTALCYTAACKSNSCVHGECVETINSHKCVCSEGFYGDKCENVVKCKQEEVTIPTNGRVTCTHTYGNFSYDSLCQYSCEEGYQLSHTKPLICNASTAWSTEPPTCQLVQCEEMSRPANGFMKCSDPLGSSSYQSTCEFSCEEGHVLADPDSGTLQCEASGFWNSSQPYCVAARCPALHKLENGIVNCGDDADVSFSYGNTCSFSCATGYRLVGASRVTCTSAEEWSDKIPHCEAIVCQKPKEELHLIPRCSHPLTELRPESTCSFSCDAGFELQGALSVECSADGQWSQAMPTCKALGCPVPEISANVQMSCNPSLSLPVSPGMPYPLSMVCTFSCAEGHELHGTLSMECAHPGQWTSTPPICTAVRCPSLEAPEHGQMNCSSSEQVYNSQCSFTCTEGHSLHGYELLICDRNGSWTGERPACQAVQCPALSGIMNGVMNCGDAANVSFIYGNTCNFSCAAGYSLVGASSVTCTSAAEWSEKIPHCEAHPASAVGCPPLPQPDNGYLSCSEGNQTLNSTCRFKCNSGFLMIGSPAITCGVAGVWSGPRPACTSYKRALLVVAGCGACSAFCCICLCWMKRRKRKKVTQERHHEEESPMFQTPVDARQIRHHKLLIAVFMIFAQDLCSRGRAHAWTYNYSVSPSRRWLEASQWCKQHFTGMAMTHNQEEADYLNNLLPFNPKYYWIGVRKVEASWIWEGTNEPISKEAENWAPEEPDSITGQDCVEIYIKRDEDTTQWNNESCRKKKGTICYSDSCKEDVCSVHADCIETVGNYTCRCHPGFWGSKCDEATTCKPLLDPEHSSHHCSHPYGSYRFNSSCHFNCELGFRLIGESELQCQASGLWDHPVPLCQVVQCPELNLTNISAGSSNCSHAFALSSYNSTCDVRCDEGYELHGHDRIWCDHRGQWTPSVPACTMKKCSPILFPVTGNMTCMDTLEPFSYGSQCDFTCQEGYYLTGDSTLTCLASKQWSKPLPTCKVVQCHNLKAPPSGSILCQDAFESFSYGSVCTVQCEEGFDLIGANVTTCSSQGNWSHLLPVCRVKRCEPVNLPHGSLSCSDPHGVFSFGSRCNATCNEGFSLNGSTNTECSSLGLWSAATPKCLAKRCPTLNPPRHGTLVCSDPHKEFSFASHCNMTCKEGFVLNGTAFTQCTSLGTWTADIPRCLVKRCPSLSAPSHGSLVCSDPHEEFSFSSQCNSTCEEGFFLNGTADTECTSEGVWSTDIPLCLAKKCSALKSPAHGALLCSGPNGEFSFGFQCTSTCDEGFVLNGTADTECTSLGTWSADIPRCMAHSCPLLAKAPQHGSMNCSHPHSPFSFGSHCDFKCSEGFWLRGTSTITCNSSGHWSQIVPTCQPVQCEEIHDLALSLSMNCSHPLGNFSFRSQCDFICKEGSSMNGSEVLFCSSAGVWSDTLPICTEEGLPVGTAMLMYTGVGAASVVVPLILIGLVLLIMMRCKKKGTPIMSDESRWEETENPAFEF
ncbi:uncharacterized protein V6R79_014234 [Siganus canaliculatus]